MNGIGAGRWPRWPGLCAGLILLATPGHARERPERRIDPERAAAALEQLSSTAPFCGRAGQRLAPEELRLCNLAPAARARCPAFALACERALGDTPPLPEPPLPARETWEGSVLVWILRAAGLGLLAALLVVLGRALLHLLRATAEARTSAPADVRVAPRTSEGSEVPDGPEPLLARARSLAAAGDHAGALVALHLGVLSSLDARGLVNSRPGRTNGEYARELQPKPELLAAFREVTAAVERVQFGRGSLDAGGFERLLQRAAPLLPALLLGLLLSFGGFACGEESPGRTASEVCGSGAAGHSLLCGVLEAAGARVQRRYRSLDRLADASQPVDVIILLRQELGESAVRSLGAWVRAGGVLVLPLPLPALDRDLGVERSTRPCGAEARVAGSERVLATVGPGLSAAEIVVDARCPSGDAFVAHAALGTGLVFFVPTPAALSNASLAAGDNAALLVSLLFPADAIVELIGDWTRDQPENPLAQVRAAGLLPWVLQLLVLGLCYGLYRGTPFARRRAPPEVARRRFSEHAEALGQRWAEARAATTALNAYAGWASEQLRERLPSGADPSVSALAQIISEKTGRPEVAVVRTLEAARRAQHGPGLATGTAHEPAPDEGDALATLKLIGRLLEGLGGPR
jgi:hypothetical protein